MKIDSISNSIGGYPAIGGGAGLSHAKSISSTANSPLSDSSIQGIKMAQPGRMASSPSPSGGLTSAERAYFAKLFPDLTRQISSQRTYSQGGANSSMDLGQIINTKV